MQGIPGQCRRTTPAAAAFAPNGTPFDRVVGLMASQWCGCGAVPGRGLAPSRACAFAQPRPLVVPGYGAGPHGFDTLTWRSMPNTCADYPLIANVPDIGVDLDPMDSRLWNPPTAAYGGDGDTWAPWGYAPGPKV